MFKNLFKKRKGGSKKMPAKKLKGYIKVTRVYGRGENVKQQPVVLSLPVESFRPRNVKGQDRSTGTRCSIVTKSGKYINVKERFSEVERLILAAQSD